MEPNLIPLHSLMARVFTLNLDELNELKSVVDARFTRMLMQRNGAFARVGRTPRINEKTSNKAVRGVATPQNKPVPENFRKRPGQRRSDQVSRYLNIPQYRAFKECQSRWNSVLRRRTKLRPGESAPSEEEFLLLKTEFDSIRQTWIDWKINSGIAVQRPNPPDRQNPTLDRDGDTVILASDEPCSSSLQSLIPLSSIVKTKKHAKQPSGNQKKKRRTKVAKNTTNPKCWRRQDTHERLTVATGPRISCLQRLISFKGIIPDRYLPLRMKRPYPRPATWSLPRIVLFKTYSLWQNEPLKSLYYPQQTAWQFERFQHGYTYDSNHNLWFRFSETNLNLFPEHMLLRSAIWEDKRFLSNSRQFLNAHTYACA